MSRSSGRFELELREVVGLTGISRQLLHAWERRYKIVQPRRGPKSARLYSDAQVHHLQLLKKCIESGYRIGELAALDVPQLKDIAVTCTTEPTIPVGDIIEGVQSIDTRFVEDRLSLHFAALGPVRFAQTIVVPLMTEVGSLWDRGKISIEAEHYVTSIVRTLLGQGLRLTSSSNARATAIYATPPGELHELGVLTAAVLAQSVGIRALYLGAQLPVNAMVRAAKSVNAGIICLGSTALSATQLEEHYACVAESAPSELDIWLGGPGFCSMQCALDHRSFVFGDVSDYVDAAGRFLARMSRHRA